MQLRSEHTTNTRVATPLLIATTYTLQPGETLAISSKMPYLIDHNATRIVILSSHMEEHESIFITSSLSTVNNNEVGYQVITFSDMPDTLPVDTHMADFRVLTPEHIKHIKPVDPSTYLHDAPTHRKHQSIPQPTDENKPIIRRTRSVLVPDS